MAPIQVSIDSKIKVFLPPKRVAAKIKQETSFTNPEYESAKQHGRSTRGIPRRLRLYEEKDGTISVPRGFWQDLKAIIHSEAYQIEAINNSVSFEPEKISSQIELKDYQAPWVESVLLQNQGVGVAPPGAGKTICGLELYARLGQPCLWVTHTRRLAHQAAKRAESFLGVEAGLIGAGKEDLRHFTVGLVPTLVRRDLSQYADKFGLIITDEVHHVPSTTFTKVISAFPALYRYGLTATPYRDDGLEKLIFLIMGEQLAYLDKDILRSMGKLMTPTVYRRPTQYYFPYDPSSRKFNYQALADDIAVDQARNEQIATDVIVEASLREDNICIVLVGRIEHAETLHEIISPVIPATEYVHSKMSDSQSEQVLSDFEEGHLKVLIATYRMLAEGFDYQPSNRLFLTAPFKGRTLIEQACGRIERTYPGKEDAIVYDYVDVRVGVLDRQAEARLDIYEANNTPFETIT